MTGFESRSFFLKRYLKLELFGSIVEAESNPDLHQARQSKMLIR
jgi:hypothetical protein